MSILTRAIASFKSLTAMQWGRTSSWFSMLVGSTSFDYRASAGNGTTNAAVMACVRFAQRTLPEAPLEVVVRTRDGELQPAPDHALQEKLEAPNPYYSGQHLLGAAVADLMLTGNAYIVKVRTANRRVAQLWWVPASLIEPAWPDDNPAVFISHYDYQVEGNVVRLDVADVVHVRDYMTDPQNVRKGISPLASLWREIASDNEAANWTGSLLRNGAVPGVIISPKGDTGATEDDLEDVKVKFQQRFGGDQRGAPLVMRGATDVQVLSFNPQEMNLRELRIVPEERITAVLGIPAIVAGLGAGLQRSTFANYAEAREAAYESFVIPMQRLLASQLQAQLVPDFGDPKTLRVRFDLSEVRVLQDDQNALHERARADLAAGLLTLNQALGMIGEDPVEGEAGDCRYVPNTVTVKTLDTLIPEEIDPSALEEPTPLRALPAGDGEEEEERAATRAWPVAARKAVDPADADLIDRYDAGLARLSDDLADELLDAFEGIAEALAGRYAARQKAVAAEVADAHEPIRRLLRGYVLKGMRQAAEDLAPLTGAVPVRIQRNNPEVRAAVASMELRLPGIIETTEQDFTRLLKRLERRPGSVSLDEVRSALLAYVEETYPARASMIANTELGYAHARGVLLVAEKSGIASRVHVSDGDGDGPCRARNGTVVTLEEARGIGLAHPRCRLRLIPVVGAA